MIERASVLRWVLLTAIVAASGFLAWWTWQTTNALERLGERSVIESTALLVREKLDRVEQMIITADNAVNHLVDPDDLDAVATRLPELGPRISPTVRAVMVLDTDLRVLRIVSRGTDDDILRFRNAFADRLRFELRLGDEAIGGHRHWHGTIDGQTVMVSYLTRESNGRRFYVVLETDVDYFLREVLPTLFDDPLARERFNLTDDSGRLVYGRSLSTSRDFLVSARFPTTFYKWRLSAAPRAAPELSLRAKRRRVAEGGYVGLSLVVILAGVVFLLYAARKESRLNLLKSDFIATVSHELKTPLSLIRMFGEMLASERVASNEKRRQYLEIIVRESERLTALIENVLDFARIERGRASYELAATDLGAVITRAVELFRYRIDEKGPRLTLQVAEGLPKARLDERAVQLLFFNLLDNALKYAATSEEITVRVLHRGRSLILEVEDHGPGIAPEDSRRIFEQFYRGQSARSGSARGSGIGLALVKHIARSHNGQVSVRASPGGGATFSVQLPTT